LRQTQNFPKQNRSKAVKKQEEMTERKTIDVFNQLIVIMESSPAVIPLVRSWIERRGDGVFSPNRRAGTKPKLGHETGKAAFLGKIYWLEFNM